MKISKKDIIIVTPIFIIIVMKLTFDYFRNNEIDKYTAFAVGQVIKTYTVFPASDYIVYKYFVNRKEYIRKTSVETHKRHCKYSIQNKFMVEYSMQNPNKSRILLDCRLSDTLSFHSSISAVDCQSCY